MPPKKPVATKPAASKPAAKTTATKGKPAASKTPATSKTTAAASKAPEKKAEEPPKPVIEVEEVPLKTLGQIIQNSPDNKWHKSGKWPLLLDPSTAASTFLRYRDTNFLQAVSPPDMEAERIRLALLGGLRYGKPMVIDMGEIDRFDLVMTQVNKVQDGLIDKILDKSILQEDVYNTLVKDDDDVQYKPQNFTGHMTEHFVFIVIMSGETATVPPPDAGNRMHFILINK